jgi:F-type H+-transporting ATPase subunit delta
VASPTHAAARVYAEALAELGRDTKSLGAIWSDLEALRELFRAEPWFRQFFSSPKIDRPHKWAAVEKAFTGRVTRQTLGLMKVLVMKGREDAFQGIVTHFEALKDEAENRIHAHVTVAKPLAADLRSAVEGRVAKASGRSVVLHEHVDAAVLGGAAIRVGDRVIDRTLRTRLAAMKKELLTPSETTRNKKP